MKVIVVEGPDGSGKSTLLSSLRYHTKRHFLTVQRSGPPNDRDVLTRTIEWFSDSISYNLHIICDRHPLISEPIYGVALRGENLLETVYDPEELPAIFSSHIDRIIYCRPSRFTIERSIGNQPQLKGVMEKLVDIIDAYDEIMYRIDRWGIPVIKYDWQQNSTSLDNLFFGELP